MIFLLVFIAQLWLVGSQHISLIGSRLLSPNHDYKAFISSQNLNENSLVTVTLKSNNKNFENSKMFNGPKENLFEEIHFELPDPPQDNYYLTITYQNDPEGICNKQSVQLIDLTRRPIIFIQTDKSIYSTKDMINFRVVVLTQKLLPYNFEYMEVTILDSSPKFVEKFSNISQPELSVFENSLRLAESPNLGFWKVQVEVDGYKKSQKFQVRKSEELQVDIQVDRVIAFASKTAEMIILIKNGLEKSFNGTARISSYGNYVHNGRWVFSSEPKYVAVASGRNPVLIDFRHDLDLEYLHRDVIIRFNVDIVEDISKRSQKMAIDVKMQHKGTHSIAFIKSNQHFRPGNKFPVEIQVRKLNGQIDGSFHHLTLSVDYHNMDPNTRVRKSDRKILQIGLRKGDASLDLNPGIDAKKMILDVHLPEMRHTEVIEPILHSGNEEHIEVTLVSKSHHIGDVISLEVESTSEMEVLHVLVISREGIIFSTEYPQADSTQRFDFSLKLTEEMQPESTVVVYYIRSENGVLVYDTLELNLGLPMGNTLSIATIENAKPSDKISVHIKSDDGSRVYLKAVDADAQNDRNEVTSSALLQQILKFKSLGFEDPSDYELGRFNGFVLQPIVAAGQCGSNVTQLMEIDLKNLDHQEFASPYASVLTLRYFPEVWLYENFDTSGDRVLGLQLPETLTSWRIQGMSIHPTKGFAVASQGPKIQIITEFSVRIYAPAFMRPNEVIKIQYGVFNYLKHQISTFVFVEIQNCNFMDENVDKKDDIECRTYTPKTLDRFTDSFEIDGASMSEIKWFLIRPSGDEAVNIKITAVTKGQHAEGVKVIEVWTGNERQLEENKNCRLFGVNVDGIDKIFTNYGLSEYKMSKFTAEIIGYKLSSIENPEVAQNNLDELKLGYQEALYLLHYFLTKNSPQDIRLVSQIVKNLLDIKNFMVIDRTSIDDALGYLVKHQNEDGSYSHNPTFDARRDIGADEFQGYILTALVTATFLKDDEIKQQFKLELSKSLNFLKNPESRYKNDYEKSIIGYLMALSGETEYSKELVTSIKGHYRGINSKQKHQSVFVEIASYLIMTKILNGNDPTEDVKWLLSQKTSKGAFYGPYDTVIAAQALFEYKSSNFTDFQDNCDHFGAEVRSESLLDAFKVTISTEKVDEGGLEIRIDTVSVEQYIKVTNMVIIEAEVPSGYKYTSYEKTGHIRGYEAKEDGTLVIFYVSGMEYAKKYLLSMKVEKIYEVDDPGDSTVKIYDYYRPNLQTTQTYKYNINAKMCRSINERKEESEGWDWWIFG